MRKVALVLAVVVCIAVACGGSSTHTITGSLDTSSGSGLLGGGGSDVSGGDQVRVTDESGKTLGTGTLHSESCGSGSLDVFRSCFTFTVENVGGAKFYEFKIRRHGSEQFSHSELARRGWRVSLSLG
jgi:hypothetical protein